MRRSHDSACALAITPATLERAPHLAVLDVIAHALDTAAWALLADFPGLMDDPHPWRPEPPEQLAAQRLLRQMHAFERALIRYRRTLARLHETSTPPSTGGDDIDF